jgi:single-stranded DNA-binding protein
MIGENFVVLTGTITYPNLKTVGVNNTSLLNAKLAVPTDKGRSQYVKIAAWNTTAEALAEIPKNMFVKIHGHIEERSYDGKCRHCSGYSKVYWTNVVVDNFIVVEE